jgi:hypothetical protein
MTTIIRHTGKYGQLSFRAQLRRQGAPPTERHLSLSGQYRSCAASHLRMWLGASQK